MSRAAALPAKDPRHGSTSGYAQGCRCAGCVEANRVYHARWRATTTAPIRHGTASAYSNRGCRCEPCTQAGAAKWQHYASRVREP